MFSKFTVLSLFVFLLAACGGGGSPAETLAEIHTDDPSDSMIATFDDHLDVLEQSCPNDGRDDIAGYMERGHAFLVDEDGINVSMLEFSNESVRQLGGTIWHEDDCVNAFALVMMAFQD